MFDDTYLARTRCLELALQHFPSDAISKAGEFYAFVSGATNPSPREQINAALDEAGVH